MNEEERERITKHSDKALSFVKKVNDNDDEHKRMAKE